MLSQWKLFFKDLFKLEYEKIKHWKGDLGRGWDVIQERGTFLADRSFSQIELLQVNYRLERINQKLFQAYRILGKKVADHWTTVHPMTEEERKRDCRRIHLLLEERQKALEQIKEIQGMTFSQEKASTMEKKPYGDSGRP